MNRQTFDQRTELREVLKQYGWEPTFAQNVGGEVWRVTLNDGVYALKRSGASREKLFLLHRILEEIRSQGFSHLLPWIPNKQGKPVVSLSSGNWYATPWKNSYGVSENEKRPTATELVQALAHFHRLSEPLIQSYPDLCTHVNRELFSKWKQKQEEMAEISERIKSREFESPFEKCLTQHKDNIEQSLSFFLRGMERFMETEGGKPPRYALCHRRIHPSNVVRDQDHFYFIDLDHAQVDSPVRDLAVVMRRYTSFSEHPEKPLQLLEAYESEWSLQPKEKKLLALYLAYPERLLKTIRRYYTDPKIAQTEAQAVKRLEEELHQLEQLQEAVKSLWPNKKARTDDKRSPSIVSISDRSGKKKPDKKRKQ